MHTSTYNCIFRQCRECGYDIKGTSMRIHTLELAEPYFTAVMDGVKTFELRQYTAQGADKPARDFKVGDTLFLACAGHVTLERKITYILKDTDPCMEGRMMPGYCILGIE